MLSDSCLSPFPRSMARERSAGYKRRDPHPPCYPPITHSPPTPLQSPIPHSEPVQQSPKQQQRRLITVKHLRLLFNSLPAIATQDHKQRGWKQTQNREQWEDNAVFSVLLAWESKGRTPIVKFDHAPFKKVTIFALEMQHTKLIEHNRAKKSCFTFSQV